MAEAIASVEAMVLAAGMLGGMVSVGDMVMLEAMAMVADILMAEGMVMEVGMGTEGMGEGHIMVEASGLGRGGVHGGGACPPTGEFRIQIMMRPLSLSSHLLYM